MQAPAGRRLPAPFIHLTIEAVFGFAYMMMGLIFSVYLIVQARLDAFQLVILGTLLEAIVLVFEVPTGVVADLFSRRASVIIGIALSGAGYLGIGLAHDFWLVAAAQGLWGVGYTFISGAQIAWITDEVGEKAAARLYVRGAQYSQFASVLGIAAGAGLATIDLSLPLIASGIVLFALATFLIVTMPEEHFPGRDRTGERGTFLRTFSDGIRMVRTRHVLLLIMVITVIQGASTEGFDRLAHLHLIADTGIPSFGGLDRVLWFGVLDGGGLILAIAASEWVKRKVDITSHHGAALSLALIDVALIATVVIFGLLTSFHVALVVFWMVTVLRAVNEPIYDAWINQGLDPASRATVNSLGSQAHAFGEMAGGPPMGLVARSTVPGAIVVSGLLRAPALLLFWRALRRGTVGTVPPRAIEPETPEAATRPSETVAVNLPDRP